MSKFIIESSGGPFEIIGIGKDLNSVILTIGNKNKDSIDVYVPSEIINVLQLLDKVQLDG